MMTSRENEWSANAEAAMMGFVIPIESEEHLRFVTDYVMNTLATHDETRINEVVENALHKYNSNKKPSIQWFTTSTTPFGRLLTFVRDKSKLTLKSGKPTNTGSLAWVENIDYPDCSELGCVFFQNVNGKIKRIA